MFFRPISQQNGFTLLEVVVYVSLLVIVSVMAMNALFGTSKAFSDLRISRDINDSSVAIMERLTRDIKSSTNVDLVGSTFGTTPGRLKLYTTSASGTPVTVEYVVTSSTLHVWEDGVDMGSIMSAGTKIDELIFRYISTGSTIAIKTELHISSSRGSVTSVDHFYNTSVLRGSY